MPASEARIAANRANALKSTGPRTPEGKAVSRRNSLKHGMAGSGVVVPLDDSAEVERRRRLLEVELAPKSVMGRFYAGRLAELTVRVERCSEQERAAVARHVAHAEAAFDEARVADVDYAIEWIANEPSRLARKLRSMPEGVDRLIATLVDLRDAVDLGTWRWTEGDKLSLLMGRKFMESPTHRVRALSEAIGGNFEFLAAGDGEGLDRSDRVDWARQAMADLIDDEVEVLLTHRATLDLEAIEVDRATAPARALFDPSKEATLARRYEAAAEREIHRVLRDFQRVEAMAVVAAEEPSLGSTGNEDIDAPEEPSPPPRRSVPADPMARPEQSPASGRASEGPNPVGTGGRGPG